MGSEELVRRYAAVVVNATSCFGVSSIAPESRASLTTPIPAQQA